MTSKPQDSCKTMMVLLRLPGSPQMSFYRDQQPSPLTHLYAQENALANRMSSVSLSMKKRAVFVAVVTIAAVFSALRIRYARISTRYQATRYLLVLLRRMHVEIFRTLLCSWMVQREPYNQRHRSRPIRCAITSYRLLLMLKMVTLSISNSHLC